MEPTENRKKRVFSRKVLLFQCLHCILPNQNKHGKMIDFIDLGVTFSTIAKTVTLNRIIIKTRVFLKNSVISGFPVPPREAPISVPPISVHYGTLVVGRNLGAHRNRVYFQPHGHEITSIYVRE